MTVSTEISSNEYTGNGLTTDFDYKFRIFKANQLSVITSDAGGDNVVTLRLGTDYTVTGANKSAGGKVILTKPLANGHKISIARDIPITQETSFRNQSKFFAETHEDAFDYLTMIIQRIWGSLGSLYLKRPNILANWFDAKGYRIANLGKPKRDTDAVDLGTLKDEISGVNSTILKCEKRVLRVDDMDIVSFPKVQERRNKQIGFDSSGIPTLLNPSETGVLGYAPVDSFEKGATLTSRYQILFWEEKREYFRWDEKLPKVVPPNSTPNETGGIKTEDNPNGLWISVGDASLRGELGNGIKTVSTISELESYFPEKLNKLVYVNAYHSRNRYKNSELDGGGQFVYDSEMPRSKHDGGNIISPTVPWSAGVSYLKGTGETAPLLSGCWVRQTSDVYAGNFGIITGSRDDGKYNAAIINEIQSKLDKSDRLILPKGEVYIGSPLDFGKSKSVFGYNPVISPAYELSWTYTNLIIDHTENAISYGTSCRFYGLLVTQADASTFYKTAAFVAKSDDYDGGARSQFNCISTWHFKVGIYANRWSCVFNAIASTVKYTDPTKYTPTCSILLAGPVNNCEVRNCRLENTTVGGSTGIVIREEITDSNPDEFGVIPTDIAAQNDETGGLNSLRTGGAMLRIENNDITECYSGIKVIKTVKTIITGNYFENNTRDITIDGGNEKSFGRVDILENNASKRIASQRYVIVESGSGIINLSGNNVTGANNHTTDGEIIIASNDSDVVTINSDNNSSARGRWFASTTSARRSRISSSRTGIISFTIDLSKGNQWFFFSLPNAGEVLFTYASQIRGNFITPNGATFSVGYQAGGNSFTEAFIKKCPVKNISYQEAVGNEYWDRQHINKEGIAGNYELVVNANGASGLCVVALQYSVVAI